MDTLPDTSLFGTWSGPWDFPVFPGEATETHGSSTSFKDSECVPTADAYSIGNVGIDSDIKR